MRVAKAALISRLVLALRTWICSPMARVAVSAALKVASAFVALAGLMSTATRVAAGTSSRRISSPFATNSTLRKLMPVRLPPGRARLATSPSLTGSSVGGGDQGIRHGKSKDFSPLQVDFENELYRGLDWQLGWLLAAQAPCIIRPLCACRPNDISPLCNVRVPRLKRIPGRGGGEFQ